MFSTILKLLSIVAIYSVAVLFGGAVLAMFVAIVVVAIAAAIALQCFGVPLNLTKTDPHTGEKVLVGRYRYFRREPV
jgi:hypothetical protein